MPAGVRDGDGDGDGVGDADGETAHVGEAATSEPVRRWTTATTTTTAATATTTAAAHAHHLRIARHASASLR
jgi:hypothetical protein